MIIISRLILANLLDGNYFKKMTDIVTPVRKNPAMVEWLPPLSSLINFEVVRIKSR